MIFSMTGYATGSCIINEDSIIVEIRTLNSKFFDFSIKLPEEFFILEEEIKKITQKKLKRGKIEIRIKKNPKKDINEDVSIKELKIKMAQIQEITPNASDESLLQAALLLPRFNRKMTGNLNKKTQKEAITFFQNVIEKVIKFRKKEGITLHKVLIKYLKKITLELNKIKKRDRQRITLKKDKIKLRLNAVNVKYDKKRLEEEIIYYIEKMDITEEIVRLDHHLNYFSELIFNEEQVGKKITFLLQEMLREVNTIGSKSNDFQLQKSVVVIKEELEKTKEQVQNVL